MSQSILFTDWPATTLLVRGDDRVSLLHNMCTADVRSMAVGEVREAFFTNVKGHVLAHALLACRDDAIAAILFQPEAESLVAQLSRYIIREDVDLTIADRPPLLAVATEPPGAGDWFAMPVLTSPAWICVDDQRVESHFAAGDHEMFNHLRVGSAWPLQGIDFADGTLPQELNRDATAISFNKGCYLGQETIARLDALGHVNKQIVLVEGDAAKVGGVLHHQDKEVGAITSAASCEQRQLGIAMVRRGSNATGTLLDCNGGQVVVVEPPAT